MSTTNPRVYIYIYIICQIRSHMNQMDLKVRKKHRTTKKPLHVELNYSRQRWVDGGLAGRSKSERVDPVDSTRSRHRDLSLSRAASEGVECSGRGPR